MIKDNTIKKYQAKLLEVNNKLAELHDQGVYDAPQLKILQNHYENEIKRLKHYKRLISLYEKSNHKWFNGNVCDVSTFEDLLAQCEDKEYTPLDLIKDGVYIAVGGSAIAPYDLREYCYLPHTLIEEDEDWSTLKECFKGYVITQD